MLYIPSCWWHELHNLESSIAINSCWRGVPTTPKYKRAMRHTQWSRFVTRVKRKIPLAG